MILTVNVAGPLTDPHNYIIINYVDLYLRGEDEIASKIGSPPKEWTNHDSR